MKSMLTLMIFFLVPALVTAQPNGKLEAFDLRDVRLLDGPFKVAQQTDIDYMLALDPDRLLAPFLNEAGLKPKADYYPNWETKEDNDWGLSGHIGGHYLSALAMMYASTGDERIKQRLDFMIKELKNAQQKNGNGYVGGIPNGKKMWDEIKHGNVRVKDPFNLNDRWVPLYNIHKTYAGLRDAYLYGGNEDAKKMLIKLTDWMLDVTEDLSDDQIQDMLRTEYGGLNETFADVATIVAKENPSKSKQYMELARRFSQKALLDPMIRHEDILTGMHANTQIPKVIGFKRIADLDGDKQWSDAAEFFWDNVTEKRSVSIGGNSVREHFHPIDDFKPMIDDVEGPETCNTYNMLKLTKLLFLDSPQDRYIEYFERALYNHILSTEDPIKGGFVYFTSMRPGHYRVYSQPQKCFWCCVGSGLENHAKYGDLIYAHNTDELYVNLFIASVLRWKDKGVMLTQQTQFPDEPKTSFTIDVAKPTAFTLKLRYPTWIKAGSLKLTINGAEQTVDVKPGEYIGLKRTWSKGDTVELQMPMHLEAEQLPDGENYYSFRYGPIVLAAKTTTDDMPGLFADAERMAHVAQGKKYPLTEMPVIIGDPDSLTDDLTPVPGEPLTFAIKNLYSPLYKNLDLIPFFRVQESRYIVYWRTTTADQIKEMEAKMAAEEAGKQKLDAATIDMVYPGEQQPESDHFIDSRDSQTGTHMGRHWRDATGWFSYILKDKKREAKKLRIMYYGGDRDRNFKIIVNGSTIASEQLNGSYGDDFFTEDYTIPESVLKSANGVFTVKFQAEQNSRAGGIFEVRLMK